MKLIAIDGGTTHTRLYLTDGVTVFDSERKKAGAGSNRDGSLAAAVREGVDALLARNALSLADIDAVTASGMIGSELGLHAIPYVPAPATLAQIAEAAEEVRLPEVCRKPILFFPGVRGGDGSSLAADDVMRGEETEYFGLVRIMGVRGKVARETIVKLAELLGLEAPEGSSAASAAGAAAIGARARCPNFECPSNLPYWVGGQLLFLPLGTAGSGTHCAICGEVLERACPHCGAPVLAPCGCCEACGSPLVELPEGFVSDPHAWAEAQRAAVVALRAALPRA